MEGFNKARNKLSNIEFNTEMLIIQLKEESKHHCCEIGGIFLNFSDYLETIRNQIHDVLIWVSYHAMQERLKQHKGHSDV